MTNVNRQIVKSSRRHVAGSRRIRAADEVRFSFEDLEVYQAARDFKKRCYALAALLPDDERYRLKFQMRKAGLSLTNAISEGHGRYSYKDRRHYCHEARGSLQELVDDINDCQDNDYARPEHLQDLKRDAFRVLQLIDGWARWLASQHAATLKKKARALPQPQPRPPSPPKQPAATSVPRQPTTTQQRNNITT
jgi:four helix bundle protein